MIKLEHIVFYRGLGFSLNQIKRILAESKTDKNADELLSAQKVMLYNQIYNIQNSISAIEASQEIISAGIKPDEAIAQILAMEWTEMVQKVAGGNPEHEQAFLVVDNQREVWNPAERELIEKAEPFLEEALNIYYQKQE